MTQFYIVEVQQYTNGEFGHIVHWAFDENPDTARLKAESKYYEVLAAAAVSNLPSHAAILFSTDGFPLMNKCYKHDVPIVPTAREESEDEIPEEPEENDLPQDDTPADPGDDEPGGPDVSEQEEPEETEGE